MPVADWALPAIEEYGQYRRACLYGGRGRGATEALGRLVVKAMLENCDNVLVGREHQKSIQQSNIALIKRVIRESEYAPHFDLTKRNQVRCVATGAACDFKGIRLSLEDWRSISDYQLIWLEEPQHVTDEQLDVILPSLREDATTLVASWNPELEGAPIERLLKYPDTLDLFATYQDNAFFPAVLEEERQQSLADRPREIYEWIWDGKYRPLGAMSPWTHTALAAAIAAPPLPTTDTERVTGIDFAYTENATSDYTAVVTLDLAGNVTGAERFRVAEYEARHERLLPAATQSLMTLCDTTDGLGRSHCDAMRSTIGRKVRPFVFSRPTKAELVHNGAKRLSDRRATFQGASDLIDEMRQFVGDEQGRYAAARGHDDLVCAWLLAVEALRQVGR